ncbi:hypothetical protein L1D29_06615 [Shewanella insulae]|uniref:hypothetical protein n=1 Tax=Shewanella insulae TaxID=2681496 RepID=UPI001EFC82EE|nr:hypothetical protein [Shewanella insulae]MCG9712484.1 hypothetical protein [Shewanella insulae]
MNETIVTRTVIQPEISDHEEKYSKFLCNTPKKTFLFNLITQAESISNALVVAEETGSSPIVVFETLISDAINSGEIEELDSHEKQFVGTVACTVMEANGWQKTNKKQRFSVGIFRSAELYELAA